MFLPTSGVLHCELLYFDLGLLVVDLNWKVLHGVLCTMDMMDWLLSFGYSHNLRVSVVWCGVPFTPIFLLVPWLIVFSLG